MISLGIFWLSMLVSETEINKALVAISLLVIISGIYALSGLYFMMKKDIPTAFNILMHQGDDIVWIYRAELQMMPFGVDVFHRGRLHICTLSGEVFMLRASNPIINRFINTYTTKYEHITKGYSIANQQLFDIDPKLLIK